ncbi:ankyrin repeat and ibr domain containing protein, putative [Entamoeba invadens IP1]|uniref:RBR-type E3 ubiquitin transferase n=1 Tax=Entamoeba invadens IP1 TaxID=370355 RepID=A0A0A1U0L7_ENTIV|nr:ankyrin repeat and ibr domain containing protein, putative [Entamoeba invadens IP1]ELP87440.1 ankyrin repeat and ibr domain containing protein, putative [Entamoeba invadens IP1]|eukprot:XP_004254211.1 ankyrin repeat and ibr domain containing protein, putative [Entamoeba invadens IP1]
MLSASTDFDEVDTQLKKYEIKPSSKIDEEINKTISQAMENTCLSQGDSILLLRSFKWNLNKMNDVYYDDQDKYLARAGTSFSSCEEPTAVTTCPVCYEDYPPNKMYALSCGHYFCVNCWKSYVNETMKKGLGFIDALCMMAGCKHKIHFELVKKTAPELADRFWYFLKKEFVEMQGNVFCPNPKCGRAIVVLSSEQTSNNIVCLCGQKFCFKCLGEFHAPATCQQVQDWQTLSTKDDENSYLLLTMKACCHCGLLCERTHGCNHMTCPKCHGEWCWMCRGDWKTHGEKTGGFYSCNIYTAGKSLGNQLDNKAQGMKAFYEKYNHYFDRWMNHNSLHRQTLTKKEQAMEEVYKMFAMQTRTINRIEEAFDVLILARSWLKYSYVHSFYLSENGGVSELFNHQQAQIETFTETLGELLFNPVSTYDTENISAKASILKKVIEHFS